jgi:hypothetical protein
VRAGSRGELFRSSFVSLRETARPIARSGEGTHYWAVSPRRAPAVSSRVGGVSGSVGPGSAGRATARMPSSGMFPPITIRTAGASSARAPISRLSFARSSRTCDGGPLQGKSELLLRLPGYPPSEPLSRSSAPQARSGALTSVTQRRWSTSPGRMSDEASPEEETEAPMRAFVGTEALKQILRRPIAEIVVYVTLDGGV